MNPPPGSPFHTFTAGLYLTSRRLLFRSHRFNIQPHDTEISLLEVTEATPVLTARLIPNSLRVTTKSGAHETFVVNGRQHWGNAIAEAKHQVTQQEKVPNTLVARDPNPRERG